MKRCRSCRKIIWPWESATKDYYPTINDFIGHCHFNSKCVPDYSKIKRLLKS